MNKSISSESFKIVTLVSIMYILLMTGVSVPVYTIHSPDGDLIDCIDIYDQPTFKDPLMKNHVLQEFPTDIPKTIKETEIINWQVWHTTGETCPTGTIPIRRDMGGKRISNKKYPKFQTNTPEFAKGHKYAIGYKKTEGKIFGTRATLSVWDPIVESPHDFSLSQIWLASGSYDTFDVNTIEAGWQIFPKQYLDHQPRLFTLWTRDSYDTTGCYNTNCSGFVHTSSRVALEAAIIRTSKIGGPQFDITLQMWKDQVSGNWWLGIGSKKVEPVGYWPATIFTGLSDQAYFVEWGGEVLYRNISGMNTVVQMGSGEFANKGFGQAAYVCNIQVAQYNNTLLPIQDFSVKADFPKYYTIKKSYTKECGNHFYYGGPGPMRSGTAVRLKITFTFLVLLIGSYVC